MKSIHEEDFRICTWDTDSKARLTPSAAFNFCQEAAGSHATDLGVGIANLGGQGIAWVLSRMSLAVDRRPSRGETVRVRTWPRGTDRLFATRDYEMLDSSGDVFARGRSAWLIVDLALKRPRRPEPFVANIPTNEGRDALADGAKGLDTEHGLNAEARRTAAYSDLDYNGHVNNARYIQWIQDAFDAEELAAVDSLRLDVNYLSEVKAGAVVEILRGGPDLSADGLARYYFEGRRDGDVAAVFRAALSVPRN